MDKLKYKMIPEGTLNDQIIPLNLIFVDARDVKAAGLSFREAFERIAKTIKEPSMMNIIDLDCVTTTSDGLMVEGAIVAMAASDRNRIHPEFGFLEMLDVPYSKELIAEEPHLRQWDILYPGRHLVMGPKAKLLPIHNAAMTDAPAITTEARRCGVSPRWRSCCFRFWGRSKLYAAGK